MIKRTCAACNGTGKRLHFSEQAWDHEYRRCNACSGSGTILDLDSDSLDSEFARDHEEDKRGDYR